MKNRKCPNHKACWDYGSCEDCELRKEITRLHKRINRLKKQNETLTIQCNAWALAVKAIKEDTVRNMRERLKAEAHRLNDEFFERGNNWSSYRIGDWIDQIAKEMLEGEK